MSSPRAVSKPEELAVALATGEEVVVLQEHMDLTTLPGVKFDGEFYDLFGASGNVKIVQGNCSSPPPSMDALGLDGEPLLPLLPGQCLLLIDREFMSLSNGGSPWLDNLYIRFKRTERSDKTEIYDLVTYVGTSEKIYMTNVTMQGDGDGVKDCANVVRLNEQAYLEDCIFADFDAHRVVAGDDYAKANLIRCTFLRNNIIPSPFDAEEDFEDQGLDDGLLAGFVDSDPALDTPQVSHIRIENCTFDGSEESNSTNFALVAQRFVETSSQAMFYSDVEMDVLVVDIKSHENTTEKTKRLDAAPAKLFPTGVPADRVRAVSMVSAGPTPEPASSPAPASDARSGSSASGGSASDDSAAAPTAGTLREAGGASVPEPSAASSRLYGVGWIGGVLAMLVVTNTAL